MLPFMVVKEINNASNRKTSQQLHLWPLKPWENV